MPPSGDRAVTSPIGKCPKAECAITVLVRDHAGAQNGVSNLKVEVLTNEKLIYDRKNTDREGVAEFKGIKKCDQTYEVRVTLEKTESDTYGWYTSKNQYALVPGGVDKFFLFELEQLVRPKFKVVREDDDKVIVPGVGVMFSNRTHFGLTKAGTGVAELEAGKPGVVPGKYGIQLQLTHALLDEFQNAFAPASVDFSDGKDTTVVIKLKPRPILKITALHDHFASGMEDWGLKYSIKHLQGKKVMLRVSSAHYADGVIYEKELTGGELTNGDDKVLPWDGKTTCKAGDLKDQWINPLYSPYKVSLAAETEEAKDEKEFSVQ